MINSSAAAADANGSNKLQASNSCSTTCNHLIGRRIVRIALVFLGAGILCLFLYKSTYPFQFLPTRVPYAYQTNSLENFDPNLDRVLKNASMGSKTVIITTLNQAWADPHSILDIFLESFRIGRGTRGFLNNLVIVCLDQKAYNRCLAIHPHCYALNTTGVDFSGEAYFMTGDYLEMMWRRIQFLATVLQMGYSFVFTDADIMWLQDPFPHFYPDADFQIACDNFVGNSYNLKNQPNGGFTYVKSNAKTVEFYKFWYASRQSYPGNHDQDVLNKIKYHPFFTKIGLRIRFLDTAYFSGFCEIGRDFNKVCTMHANCCFGLESKVHDLSIVLEDWKKFMSLSPEIRAVPSSSSWSVPQNCSIWNFHPPDLPKKKDEQGGNS